MSARSSSRSRSPVAEKGPRCPPPLASSRRDPAAGPAQRLRVGARDVDVLEDALLGAGLAGSWQTGVAAYEAVRAAAEQNLALGRTVVLDAVNDSEPARQTWRAAADAGGVRLASVLLVLDDEAEHRRRLEGRARDLRSVPEPTWEEVRTRAAAYEPWADGGCLRIDAAPPVERVAQDVLDRLDDR